MGIWDTFSRTFGFTTEEDEEQETASDENEVDEDDEEDEDEDEGTGFSFFRFSTDFFKRRSASSARSRSYEETDDEDEEVAQQPVSRQKPARNNVIHDPRMSNQAAEQEYTHCERIVVVHQIEECREIIKCLLRGESVLLNLENIDPKDCGRVVDLLSGAAFALQGRMLKVAHLSYLLAPENVEIITNEPYPNAQARYR